MGFYLFLNKIGTESKKKLSQASVLIVVLHIITFSKKSNIFGKMSFGIIA